MFITLIGSDLAWRLTLQPEGDDGVGAAAGWLDGAAGRLDGAAAMLEE